MRSFLLLSLVVLTLSSPAQNQYAWLERSNIPAPGRHGSLGLAIGNRGYIGLGHVASPGLIVYQDWWEYDVGTDTWTQKADFAGLGRDYACGFSIGNYGYVGTGQDTNINIHDDWWRYDPANNAWTYMGVVPGGARDAAPAWTISGKGYIGPDIFTNQLWEYDPGTNSWTQKSSFPGGTTYVPCVTTMNDRAYLGLGLMLGYNDWWQYDPNLDSWIQKTSMPGLCRSGSICFTMGNTIYCGTGTDWAGENFSDMYTYDAALNSWTPINDFPGTPRHLLAGFMLNNKAYFGTGTNGTNFNDFWEYGTLSGVDENVSAVTATIFPNPVKDNATISLSENISNGTLEIFDATGDRVKVINEVSGNSISFEQEQLAAGNYFFTIREKSGIISSGKFLVQ